MVKSPVDSLFLIISAEQRMKSVFDGRLNAKPKSPKSMDIAEREPRFQAISKALRMARSAQQAEVLCSLAMSM